MGAGAAEPMITGSGTLAVSTMRGPVCDTGSDEASCLGVPLRAESAANGETKLGRAAEAGSGRRASEFGPLPTIAGLAGGLCVPTAGAAATSLRNCSMRRSFPCKFCDCGVAQKTDHLAGKVGRAVAFADQMIDLAENLFTPAFGDGLHHLFEEWRGW